MAARKALVVINGQTQQVPDADQVLSNTTSFSVTQASHGFSTGDAIYYTGSAWAKAKADTSGTLGIGIAIVSSSSVFTVYIAGQISGLSGLTAGQYYFVSDAAAGSITATEPTTTTSYSNPILFATSTTAGIVLPYRPSQVGPSSGGNSTGVGTYANRPAAGIIGNAYYSTDGTRKFIDDGSAWRPDINGCLGTQPGVVSGWTWVNQSTATATDVGGAIYLTCASSATDSVSMLTKILSPSSGYTLLAHIRPALYPISFTQAGLVLRDSNGGKHVGFNVLSNTTSGVHLTINKFNSTTSFNSNYVDLVAATVGDGIWLRIVDDTTNRISSFSFDGKNFVQLHSVGRTDFLTPDTYGVGINPLNGSAALTLDSVSQA